MKSVRLRSDNRDSSGIEGMYSENPILELPVSEVNAIKSGKFSNFSTNNNV